MVQSRHRQEMKEGGGANANRGVGSGFKTRERVSSKAPNTNCEGGRCCGLWKNSQRGESAESKGFIFAFPREGKGWVPIYTSPWRQPRVGAVSVLWGDGAVVEQGVLVRLQLVWIFSLGAGSGGRLWSGTSRFASSRSLCTFRVLPVIFQA